MTSPPVSAHLNLQGVEESRRVGAVRRFLARTILLVDVICWALALAAWVVSRWIDPGSPLAAPSLRLLALVLAIAGALLPLSLFTLRGERREWERILALVLAQRRMLYLMLAGSAVLVVSELALPLVLKHLLDDVVNVRRDAHALTILLVFIVGLLLLRAVAGYLRTFNAQGLGYRIATALRNQLYAHLQRLSYSFFDRARQGELMSKITNDVVVLQNFIIGSSEDFIVAPLKVAGAVACVFYLNWRLALVIVGSALVTALLLRLTGGRLRAINRAVQERMGQLTAHLAEGLNTIRLAQGFGLERTEFDRFRQSNLEALQKIMGHVRISAVLLPTVEFLGFLAPFVVIAALSYQAIGGHEQLEIGELIAIAGYGALVANPLNKLSRLLVTLAMGEAASRRIHSVLETKPEITDAPGALELPDTDGYLVFEDVSLRYGPNEPTVLSRIDLEIMPGQVVAIVGESGSGKSSIINLVPRFYEPTGGRVLLDGHDVRQITLASLRRHIGIVSQETILVHGTVRENIAYGSPDADEKDILDVALSAGAHNFIMEFPRGYDTVVGERGVTLSGGQRQRVAIARVLLRDPRILLLDEATSALDSINEAIVQDALNKLMYGRTTLVVAHRLSTVRNADRIIVLKEGRIVEAGTHDELMGNSRGEYARLVKLQGL